MNADSEEEEVQSLLDRALKLCRNNARGGDLALVAESLSKHMACEGRVPLVDRALGMLGHGAPVLCKMMGAVMVDSLTALLPALVAGGSPPIPALRSCSKGSSSLQKSPSASDRKLAGWWTDNAVPLKMEQCKLQSLLQHCEVFCASERADDALVMSLVEGILKTAASVPALQYDVNTSFYRRTLHHPFSQPAVSPFARFLDMVVSNRERIYDKLSPCSRLYAWRSRPSLLDEDLLFFSHEASTRPLLSLLSRLLDSAKCRSFILGLALAPDILAEVRRRVHTCFLLSGSASIWNLRTELMGAVADAASRPSTWGLTDDTGVYVPVRFSLYGNCLQPWFRILKMPPTRSGLIELVSMLDEADASMSGINSLDESLPASICHDSLWSLQLDFIEWWKFALQTLFSRCDRHLTQPEDADGGHTTKMWARSREMAARYVYSVMDPTSQRLQQAGELLKIADRWIQLWVPAPVLSCCDCGKRGLENDAVGSKPAVDCSKAAKTAYQSAITGSSQMRKRGLADKPDAEAGNKRMKRINGFVDRPQVLGRWFSDFSLACSTWDGSQANSNDGCKEVNSTGNATVADDSTIKRPCRFSDYMFKSVLAADPVLLEQDYGFVLLLIVAFGTSVEVNYDLCTEMGSWLEQPDGTDAASSSRSRLCTREPQHRTEAFTEAWSYRFWQQAGNADLQDWVKGGGAIFDIFDGHCSSAASMETVQPGLLCGGKVAMLVVEFVKQLSSRLIGSTAEEVATLQDLRNRFGLWASCRRMSALALEKCASCLESLDESLSRLRGP